MDIARINAILVDSIGQIGENQQPVEGSETFNFFVMLLALKTDKVHEHAAEMIELLKKWPSESWGQPVPPLGERISYTVMGGILDSQDSAFMLFAFGKILGWWNIEDPHTMLGIQYGDPKGRNMASWGYVTIVGYQPNAV